MFEVWESASEHGLYLAFPESPSFPGEFAVHDWIELGLCKVTDDIQLAIERDGYVTFRSAAGFDPSGVLGPALNDDTV